jgi:peptide/nickel transport system substrate-binding protein
LAPSRHLVLCALFTALVLVLSCQAPTAPGEKSGSAPGRERVTGVSGGSLTYRVGSPPQTFNYLKAADEASLVVSFYLMGGRLVEFDHDAQQYAPGVAQTWKLAGDGRTLDLMLRDGAQFSDGHPLTADDVAFTFRALYDARTASPVFRDAMTISGREIEVAAIDQKHLRLVFPEPVAAPENYLSNLAVLPRHVLGADLQRGTLRDAYSLTADPQSIVTAGPFVPQSAVPGERVTLRRNPHYWKKDAAGTPLPYLDTLTVEVISDANNALARLNQGALDVYDRIRPADYAALRAQPGNTRAIDLGPGLHTDHLWFNLNAGQINGKPFVDPIKRAWFSDARFRRAVSHAIDRESIARITLQGLATPLYSFISPGNRGWAANDLPRTDYDLERARALLREAGFAIRGAPDAPELYDAGGHRVEFTLIVPVESEPRVMMATVVQEDLGRLGIKMGLAPIEFGELTRRISQSYEYEAALFGVSVTEPDPSSYTNFLRSDSPSHQWYPKQAKPASEWEARLDELAVAQAREIDPERRRAIFHEIQVILAEQLPVIPIAARHLASAASERIGNYRPSPLPPYSLWNAEELFIK